MQQSPASASTKETTTRTSSASRTSLSSILRKTAPLQQDRPKVIPPFTRTNPAQLGTSIANPTRKDTHAGTEATVSQQSWRALSTLSSAGNRASRVTSVFSARLQESTVPSFSDTSLNNPFLEYPPRKVIKRDHVSKSSSSQTALNRIRTSSAQSQEVRRQHGLVLTRVLPMNTTSTADNIRSTSGDIADSNIPQTSEKTTPTGVFCTAANMSSSRTGSTTIHQTTGKDNDGFMIPSVRSNHPSTTPKQKPKTDYYDFLTKSNPAKDIINSTDEESSDAERRSTIQLSRKALAASAMEFARKSIMQRASKSPEAAFRKVQRVANDNSRIPSLNDLLMASDADEDVEEGHMRAMSPAQQRETEPSFAPADTPFTFESTPLPITDADDIRIYRKQPQQSGHGFSEAFVRSVRKVSEETEEQSTSAQKHDQDAHNNDRITVEQRSQGTQSMQGSSRTWHKAVQVEHVLRSSMARTAPYKVPSVNEREVLRSSRAAGFRARPVDPKVFTSAGDLGVPRVVKPPLTVPISPKFSQRSVRKTAWNTARLSAEPVQSAATSRLTNLTRRPVARPHPETSNGHKGAQQSSDNAAQSNKNATAWSGRLTVPSVEKVRRIPVDAVAESTGIEPTQQPAQYHDNIANRSNAEVSSRTFELTAPRKSILGPPMRGEESDSAVASVSGAQATVSGQQVAAGRSQGTTSLKRPLTQPVPFKFATDELLRRRHVMFQPKGASGPSLATESGATSKEASNAESSKPRNHSAFKRPQPLKRLTVPVPFRLATQRRAEVRLPENRLGQDHMEGLQEPGASSHSIRAPPSRLAGLLPLSPAKSGMATAKRTDFVPTVPISPKFGRHIPVRSLRPTQFLLKKSTKELTQPHEFRLVSEQRARERETFEQQSFRRRERELEQLKQKTARLNKAREQRESLERTFRARPIKHYQPTLIHKATRPLTNPVSPMIGEKRKRYEMEMQYREQQQEREQWEPQQQQLLQQESEDEQQIRDEKEQEMYRQFEEAKILQEQQQLLQQQLTKQERRQVELANSAHATIHQPPIRLSFPLDPETEALQANIDNDNLYEAEQQPQAQSKDASVSSRNDRLSRELRRISLEASRGSSGRPYRSRLSDPSSQSGRMDGDSRRLSGGRLDSSEYFPFTRSQAPTGSSGNISTAAPSSGTTQSSISTIRATSATSGYSNPVLSAATSMLSTITTSMEAPKTTAAPSITFGDINSQEKEENRRRSGSFIPLDLNDPPPRPPVKSTPPETSRLSSRLFGMPPRSSSSNTMTGPPSRTNIAESTLSRSKGPVVIDHTLTLNDL
ncbi:hypothetical protein BGX28_007542 [Mortierella sp. GBA30]|nr:hypothetical protein BGX28_007542 [Mortierella sp. GBA30]